MQFSLCPSCEQNLTGIRGPQGDQLKSFTHTGQLEPPSAIGAKKQTLEIDGTPASRKDRFTLLADDIAGLLIESAMPVHIDRHDPWSGASFRKGKGRPSFLCGQPAMMKFAMG